MSMSKKSPSIRMCRSAGPAILLAALALGAPAVAQTRFAETCRLGVGDTWNWSRAETRRVTEAMSGPTSTEDTIETGIDLATLVEVESRRLDEPSELRLTLGHVKVREAGDPRAYETGAAGSIVVLTGAPAGWSLADEEGAVIDEVWTSPLQRILNRPIASARASFLPPRPVAVGDRWILGDGNVLRKYGVDPDRIDRAASTMTCTLSRIEDRGGVAFAVIEIELEIRSGESEGRYGNPDLDGRGTFACAVDGSVPHFELTLDVKTSTEHVLPGDRTVKETREIHYEERVTAVE